jgi:hypothetical protein
MGPLDIGKPRQQVGIHGATSTIHAGVIAKALYEVAQ